MLAPPRSARWLAASVAVAALSGLVGLAPSAPARAAASDRVVFVKAAGKAVLEIAVHGDAIRVSGAPGEPALVGERRGGGDKRKYRAEGGDPIAEVKLKADPSGQDPAGFKLRAPDGRLLWKVKIDADKIKIGADEEGARAWVISLKHPDKLKISDEDGRDVGSVKVRAGDRVTVEDVAGRERFAADAGPRSALFGVLLMESIPARERWILMAEILAAGF